MEETSASTTENTVQPPFQTSTYIRVEERPFVIVEEAIRLPEHLNPGRNYVYEQQEIQRCLKFPCIVIIIPRILYQQLHHYSIRISPYLQQEFTNMCQGKVSCFLLNSDKKLKTQILHRVNGKEPQTQKKTKRQKIIGGCWIKNGGDTFITTQGRFYYKSQTMIKGSYLECSENNAQRDLGMQPIGQVHSCSANITIQCFLCQKEINKLHIQEIQTL